MDSELNRLRRKLDDVKRQYEQSLVEIKQLKSHKKQQQLEIERIIGWCCTECDENFYLPKNSQTEQCLSVIHCPYCGGWKHTVLNTIPEIIINTAFAKYAESC